MNRLAIVTGGSKGLGRALCEHYVAQGWQVYSLARSRPELPSELHSIQCDFADRNSCAEVVRQLFVRLSKKDWDEVVLINNVGTLQPIGQVSLKEATASFANLDINLTSTLLMSGLFVDHFQDIKGRKTVAHISSGAARRNISGWSLYCASKAGMERFAECLALEQSEHDKPIVSIIINPGVMDTQMQSLIRAQSEETFSDVEQFRQLQREDKLADVQHVAKTCIDIIASDAEQGGYYMAQ